MFCDRQYSDWLDNTNVKSCIVFLSKQSNILVYNINLCNEDTLITLLYRESIEDYLNAVLEYISTNVYVNAYIIMLCFRCCGQYYKVFT